MSISTRARGTLAALVLILATGACSDGAADGAATTTATARPAPTVVLETFRGDGFEMLLPAEWAIATPDDPSIAALVARSGADFSASASDALERQVANLFRQGGRLFAFDLANARPDFVDNINIISMPGGDVSGARVASVTVEELQNRLGAIAIESEIRSVPAGEAVIISYRLPASGSEGISVTLLTGTGHWALTLTMRELGPMRDDFVTMAESFREQP